MVIGSLLGIILLIFLYLIVGNLNLSFFNHKAFFIVLVICITSLVVFGFFIPKIYYFPYANGVLGDNYHHLRHSIEKDPFIKNHHPVFPYVSEVFLNFLEKNNYLSRSDPKFLEKYFRLSIIPVNVIPTLALLFFCIVIGKFSQSKINSAIVFLLVCTSFGFWLWVLQSNSLAIAMALEMIILGFFAIWFRKKSLILLIILTLLICLGPWFHNSLIFVSIGGFIAIVLLIFLDSYSLSRKFLEVALCTFICLLAGYHFFKFQAVLNGYSDPIELYEVLSDSKFQGGLGFMENPIKAAGKNLDIGFNFMTSFPGKPNFDVVWDYNWFYFFGGRKFHILHFLHQVFFFALSIYSLYLVIKGEVKVNKGFFYGSLIISAIILIGFLLRQSGQHYYLIAMIPNFGIILSVFTTSKLPRESRQIILILILFIVIFSFFRNGFSKGNVFNGSDLYSNEIYRDNRLIYDDNPEKYSIAYFRKFDIYGYQNEAILMYYAPKFGHIKWIQPVENEDWHNKETLMDSIKKYFDGNYKIYLGEEAYNTVKEELTLSQKADFIWKVEETSSSLRD